MRVAYLTEKTSIRHVSLVTTYIFDGLASTGGHNAKIVYCSECLADHAEGVGPE